MLLCSNSYCNSGIELDHFQFIDSDIYKQVLGFLTLKTYTCSLLVHVRASKQDKVISLGIHICVYMCMCVYIHV